MCHQLDLFDREQSRELSEIVPGESDDPSVLRGNITEIVPEEVPDLDWYDYIIVAFSGGKDSVACVLHLLEMGVDTRRLELWHHNVDGRGEDFTSGVKMDWPCTPAYCEAFAEFLDVPIYHTWKCGGFDREMRRQEALTAPIRFECPTWDRRVEIKQTGGTGGKLGTRMAFPQVAADLNVRWCSAYLKIDNARTALRNQDRFKNTRTLFISGERAEESPGRANYAEFEPDDADLRDGKKFSRHIDRWRPVHKWPEQQVWDIIERHYINPHPCYRLGWSRCSCMACIFNGKDEFASLRAIAQPAFDAIAAAEKEFDRTIKRKIDIVSLADSGKAFPMTAADAAAALSEEWNEPMTRRDWVLPPGAFKGGAGPT